MFARLISKFVGQKKSGLFPIALPAESAEEPTPNHAAKPTRKKFVPPEWKPGEVIMDRYRVENVMSGSMGKVYISEHLGWGIKMAIKSPRREVLADREGFKRILTEADNWVRMGMHPNVAACYYVLAFDRIPHLFIEYVDGGDLSEWIKAGRCKDIRTALSLAIQFCHGMEYTHSKGIIHRDIKPANILITKNALLKITDFGILLDLSDPGFKDINDSTWNNGDSEETVGFRGTPAFASPEQMRDSHDVDERTDIFSFGLCMWLMLCGKKPFKKNIEKNVIPEPAPVNPENAFPPVLCDLLKKCVAYDPDDRFVSFLDLREAINKAYQAFFNVSCPYAALDNIDLRADALNNRAVSYFELGRTKEAEKWLIQALEINDTLPEAVHNMFLHKWRKGSAKSDRLIRQIEATKKSRTKITWLDELEEAVRNNLKREEILDDQPVKFPEFRLCIPRKSLEIFRESQMYKSIQRNVLDHFENKRYNACYKVLLKAWKNIGFRKDKVFTGIYEQLLRFADRGEVQGWQRLANMKGSAFPITCLERISDSRKIVMAGSDGKIVIRDFSVMKKLDLPAADDSPVHAVAVSPKGRYIAVGNEKGIVSIWSIKSGKSISQEAVHKGPVLSLAFSPNGKILASGGSDGIMKLRNPFQKGMESSISLQNSGAVRAITFFKTGKDLVTGSDDGTIRFWSAGASECLRIVEAHALPVVTLSASPDGQKFVSGSADRLIKIWDKVSARNTKVIEAHEESVTSVLMLEDNKSVISGCEDDILKLWDIKTGDCLLTLDGRGDGICSLTQAHRPHIFLAGKHDGSVLFVMVIYQLNFE